MKSSDLSRVVAAAPLNATAGRVTSRGRHWTPERKVVDHIDHWDAPPQTKHVPRDCEDLCGRTVGRFRVVGFLGRKTTGQKARWLVRCSCGAYEARTSKAIKNPANGADMCLGCRHLEHVKQRKALSVEEYLGLSTAAQTATS